MRCILPFLIILVTCLFLQINNAHAAARKSPVVIDDRYDSLVLFNNRGSTGKVSNPMPNRNFVPRLTPRKQPVNIQPPVIGGDPARFTLRDEVLKASSFENKTKHLDLFKQYANEHDVPVLLLLAIAEQESTFNDWALNIAGKSYQPGSKEDAMEVLKKNTQRSYDVGIMQINSYWLRKFELSAEDVIEPKVNIKMAAYILDEAFRSYGSNWKALGAYHHPPTKDSDRSLGYAKKVWARFLRLERIYNYERDALARMERREKALEAHLEPVEYSANNATEISSEEAKSAQ